jgi:hypothetical protein
MKKMGAYIIGVIALLDAFRGIYLAGHGAPLQVTVPCIGIGIIAALVSIAFAILANEHK